MKPAVVAGIIGGCVAVAEGVLLIVLGSLAGLAENPESGAVTTDGYIVLALGTLVLVTVFAARRRPLVLALVTAMVAASGFLVENALWIFAAAILLIAAMLAVISKRADMRSPAQS